MRRFLIFLVIVTGALPAFAHEFWIAPREYQVEPGAAIMADLKVGQKMSGTRFSYIPRNFIRFDLVQGETVTPVVARMGDIPALNMAAPKEGLVVVVHETTDRVLTYSEWAKFSAFVTHKDLAGTLEAHAARGLPQTGFKESYRRYAKSLIATGHGQGADRRTGLEVEIVALANPYTDALQDGLPVQVFFRDAPRADAQIEVFARDPAGQVTVTTLRTDSNGKALIPVVPGVDYLLDSVVMLPLDAADPTTDPSWKSLWASLTFRVPK